MVAVKKKKRKKLVRHCFCARLLTGNGIPFFRGQHYSWSERVFMGDVCAFSDVVNVNKTSERP